ncbi:MAG: spondin domain-containing protein [Roseivivax sp.]|nr:spondin domain-containing protein [Roseivivax sp.]
MKTKHLLGAIAGIVLGLAGAANAATLRVTVTNNQPTGGLYLTPFFLAFHDGSLDFFDLNAFASPAIKALAEEGNTAGLQAQSAGFDTGVVTGPAGFPGAPVLDPGETASIRLTVNPATGRFLNFASMVIPSNDRFIGNPNPVAYMIFDLLGHFTNIGPIYVNGDEVWDAGTERSNNIGAAFNAAGGTGTPERRRIIADPIMNRVIGQTTLAGDIITSVPETRHDLVATITVAPVPLPAALPVLAGGLGLLGLFGWRRRQTA